MVKRLLFLFVFIVLKNAMAQKMASDYFSEGQAHYENGNYQAALQSFQYIIDHHPQNALFPKAYYNAGIIYLDLENSDSAIIVFHHILQSSFNEKDDSGEGIMGDPYANYKHRAAEILYEIYYTAEMYDSALHYFDLSVNKYPYLHFCGNELDRHVSQTALTYSDLYRKLKQPEKAIEYLLPVVFTASYSDSLIIGELRVLLKNKKNLLAELDKSLEKIHTKTIESNGYKYTYYYIRFQGVEIIIPDHYYPDNEELAEPYKVVQDLKESGFYKMIARLK